MRNTCVLLKAAPFTQAADDAFLSIKELIENQVTLELIFFQLDGVKHSLSIPNSKTKNPWLPLLNLIPVQLLVCQTSLVNLNLNPDQLVNNSSKKFELGTIGQFWQACQRSNEILCFG